MHKVAFSLRPLRCVTVVEGRYSPWTAVNRDRTCANAGDGLQNLALLDVRTFGTYSSSRFWRPYPAFTHVRSRSTAFNARHV